MTVALPFEQYSPFPWKPVSQLPCPDHQPDSGYHGKPFVASDGGSVSDDVSADIHVRHRFTHHATSSIWTGDNLPAVPLVLDTPRPIPLRPVCQTTRGNCSPRLDLPPCRQTTMGGRSVFDEGGADDGSVFAKSDSVTASCLGVRKRKLCEMLEGAVDDCGFRTPQEMTIVSDVIQGNAGSDARIGCYHHCGPAIHECCDCDSDDFFPDVSSEIELPMCYESDDYKLRSLPADATAGDIMDNVIPDILPSCKTSDMSGISDDEVCAESAAACDRRRLLDVSLHKMRGIDDPEVSLRRSVLIANMVTKLRREIHQEDYCRTVLPKKRRSYRRPWIGSPDVDERLLPEPFCFYHGNQPRKRFVDDVQWEVYSSGDMLFNSGVKCLEHEKPDNGDFEDIIRDPTQGEERKSLLGDIDSIFQSLMACVGGS